MRLARFLRAEGTVGVGLVEGGSIVPLAAPDGPPQNALVRIAASGRVTAVGEPIAFSDVSLLAPVPRPPSIRDFYSFEGHARPTRAHLGLGMEPDWYRLPVFYFSSPHVVLGPDEPVRPPDTAELDYELEVAAIIARDGRDFDEAQAADAIAGYTIYNDWSARDLQRRESRVSLGQGKGKDFAQSLGPLLVTPDELGGRSGRPTAAMRARVNGALWSEGELADLQHSFAAMVAHASRDSWVREGDVIGSGTVGTGCILELSGTHGTERFPWLRSGDVVELEVEGLGTLRNPVA